MNFNYHNPVNLVFRAGAIDEAAERIRALGGNRALVVTGGSSAKSSGSLGRLQRVLTLGGVGARLYDRVTPNPTTTLAVHGAEAARSENCDVIVGLGGGSVMDAAKALAFAMNNPGDLSDYIFGRRPQTGPVPPIVLIPTTCGTGSEGNAFAVLTDPATGDKKSLRVPSIFPSVSLIDPSLMTGLPPAILGEVAFDAICHLMEAYLARNVQPLTEMMALAGLSRSMRALRPVIDGQGLAADWADLAWASTLGGMCISQGGGVAPHALEHPLSGRKGSISHGRGLAAICPAIYESTMSAAPKELLERIDILGKALGGTSRMDFLGTMTAHMDRLGVSTTLTRLGLTADDLPWLTANALKVSAPTIANHPVPLDEEGIFDIYRRSL